MRRAAQHLGEALGPVLVFIAKALAVRDAHFGGGVCPRVNLQHASLGSVLGGAEPVLALSLLVDAVHVEDARHGRRRKHGHNIAALTEIVVVVFIPPPPRLLHALVAQVCAELIEPERLVLGAGDFAQVQKLGGYFIVHVIHIDGKEEWRGPSGPGKLHTLLLVEEQLQPHLIARHAAPCSFVRAQPGRAACNEGVDKLCGPAGVELLHPPQEVLRGAVAHGVGQDAHGLAVVAEVHALNLEFDAGVVPVAHFQVGGRQAPVV
mmetsp:Transcript_35026/g.88136  ORF Transcript_35026/g.88136 Transcript_35026/m.88136 type:complete len:263 (-) Transcript_35026:1185-1973(-)